MNGHVWSNSQLSTVENLGGLWSSCQEQQKNLPAPPQSHPPWALGASKVSVARELPTPATWTLSHQNGEGLDPPSRPSAPHLSPLGGTYGHLHPWGNALSALIVNSSTKPFPCIKRAYWVFAQKPNVQTSWPWSFGRHFRPPLHPKLVTEEGESTPEHAIEWTLHPLVLITRAGTPWPASSTHHPLCQVKRWHQRE